MEVWKNRGVVELSSLRGDDPLLMTSVTLWQLTIGSSAVNHQNTQLLPTAIGQP